MEQTDRLRDLDDQSSSRAPTISDNENIDHDSNSNSNNLSQNNERIITSYDRNYTRRITNNINEEDENEPDEEDDIEREYIARMDVKNIIGDFDDEEVVEEENENIDEDEDEEEEDEEEEENEDEEEDENNDEHHNDDDNDNNDNDGNNDQNMSNRNDDDRNQNFEDSNYDEINPDDNNSSQNNPNPNRYSDTQSNKISNDLDDNDDDDVELDFKSRSKKHSRLIKTRRLISDDSSNSQKNKKTIDKKFQKSISIRFKKLSNEHINENDSDENDSLPQFYQSKMLETTHLVNDLANDSKCTPDLINCGQMIQPIQAPVRPKTQKFNKETRDDFFRAKKLARSLLTSDSITPANNFPTTSKALDLIKSKMELSTSSSSLMMLDDDNNLNDRVSNQST